MEQLINKRTKATLIMICIYLLIAVYSSAFAQSQQRITHSGIELAMGLHGFKTSQNFFVDQEIRSLTRGVSAGVMIGNNLLKARIRPAGVYRSTSATDRKFTIIESEAMINFYPLEFFRTRKEYLDIYFVTGINRNQFVYKDRNQFLRKEAEGTDAEFMALDKVTVVSQTAGLGLEFHSQKTDGKFLHVFAELLLSNSIYCSTDNSVFQGTLAQISPTLNIGVRFGKTKLKN
jgi:hypothetical protein